MNHEYRQIADCNQQAPGIYFRIRRPLCSGVDKPVLLRGQTNGNVVAASAMRDKVILQNGL